MALKKRNKLVFLWENRSGMVILNDSLSVILKPALSLNYENLCLIDKKSQQPLA